MILTATQWRKSARLWKQKAWETTRLARRYRALARAVAYLYRKRASLAYGKLDEELDRLTARLARLDKQAGFGRKRKGRKG